ncbi:MFS transporter [Myxococcus stipitatus]|uniref:MFS transporter n=1 Tax=Myxococcus stipitatus TaxID=83455 RepID=UPI001F1BDA2A|nr:MFS transporter [Myxococcus stipitatus]MCE9673991.1 MFS transporter [Myxococcus stipitatus]
MGRWGDRRLLYASAFLRALATGMVGVLLGLYLAALGFSPAELGWTVGAGLTGAALATVATTFFADTLGRRHFLLALVMFGMVGGVVVAWASSPWLIICAAFVGMLNGMGRDRGAALVVEQAVLPATATPEGRTGAFAWYHLVQDVGHALGALLAGFPALLRERAAVTEVSALRGGMSLYTALLGLTIPMYLALSKQVEVPVRGVRPPLSPQSRRVLVKVSVLFALDGLGGGFLTTALLSFFFHERFGVGAGEVGLLFFGARVANALSHLGAAWLSKRIGLVNTMVFTHLPSSLLLMTAAYAPSFWVAAVLFLLREGLVEMDVPTRQSYVMAVVRPEERTFAAGVTQMVRVAMWAVAPAFAGLFMQHGSLVAPLLMGAGLKVLYDVLLYLSFHRLKPPEEEPSSV